MVSVMPAKNGNGKRKRPKLVSLHKMHQGRNSLCTREIIDEFSSYVRQSLPIMHVCAMLEMDTGTYQNWMQWGEEYLSNGSNPRHEIYGEFFLAVKKAKAQWELDILNNELNGSQYRPAWVKSMTMLERRDRAHWGRTDQPNPDEARLHPDESFL